MTPARRLISMDKEWLLCNGRGGFAFGTTMGVPTRRYHGLLCVAARPPLERWMLLNAVLERLTLNGQSVELASFEFEGCLHPNGYECLTRFDYDLGPERPWAAFVYRWNGVNVIKTVAMKRGHDAVTLRYDVRAPARQEVRLDILPFFSMRDYHALRTGACPMQIAARGDGFLLQGPDAMCPAVTMDGVLVRGQSASVPPGFDPAQDWWHGFRYRTERHRGQDFAEDLFVPGWFRSAGKGAFTVVLRARAATDPAANDAVDAPAAVAPARSAKRPPVEARLRQAAHQFVVDRRASDGRWSRTILAGYPWFGDWGRDTFIALPGLLLLDRRLDEAREVLCTFASAQQDGLIPNRFSDYGDGCDYNSVDASLWFIHAAASYMDAGGEAGTWNRVLAPACERVVDAFAHGTRFDIRMDEDGLITAGNPTTQLTWMDAKQGDVVFTPRHGKPVEVNALWYHALCLLSRRSRNADTFAAMARRVAESYPAVFWNSQRKCLYDCVRPDKADDAIRPNQIFAVSLPHSALTPGQQAAVVACVRRHLLTPYGLRTLGPGEPGYRGRYGGTAFERDAAYHQGTVWAWLIGPFVEAFLRVNAFSDAAKARCRRMLGPLVRHLDDAGLGSVSEVFDGDPPHSPGGCPAQAWSVAELRRALALVG